VSQGGKTSGSVSRRTTGATFEAVELPCKPCEGGVIVNMRPNCQRSKFLDFVPANKVYDTREAAEARKPDDDRPPQAEDQ